MNSSSFSRSMCNLYASVQMELLDTWKKIMISLAVVHFFNYMIVSPINSSSTYFILGSHKRSNSVGFQIIDVCPLY